MTNDDREMAALAADVVALATEDGDTHVLLIRRADDSDAYPGRWALPGGHVDPGEDDEVTARRELAEETGLHVASLLEVGVYRSPGRDPRGRYVSFAWLAVLDKPTSVEAGDDAAEARWWRVRDVLMQPDLLAFDHHLIIGDAVVMAAEAAR